MTAIVSFGLTFKDYLSLTEAVRTGARAAAVARDLPQPEAAARAATVAAGRDIALRAEDVEVVSDWAAGGDATVTATHPYEISVLGIAVTSGLLSSSTTVRVE